MVEVRRVAVRSIVGGSEYVEGPENDDCGTRSPERPLGTNNMYDELRGDK